MSQLICALVGLGYQTHLILLDAWSSGSPQSRSRLFVCFAAPGLVPIEHPVLSHSHPPGTTIRGLGKLANGESFGSRLNVPTPLKFVSPEECFRDLPLIGDGMTGHCTKFPDHVTESLATEGTRRQLQAIPLFPRGSNFASAWKEGQGRMSREDRLFFPPSIGKKGTPSLRVQPSSRAWERLKPDRLMGTVTVSLQLASARGCPSIHWNETRCLTLLEFRRAQSFPDSDILVGSKAQCMKLIGNSVARTVAISLGLVLREAWLKNDEATRTTEKAPNHVGTKRTLISRPAMSISPQSQPAYSSTAECLTRPINQPSDQTTSQATARINILKRRSEVLQDPQAFREKLMKSPRLTQPNAANRDPAPRHRSASLNSGGSNLRRSKQLLARSFVASSASSSNSESEQKSTSALARKQVLKETPAAQHTTLSRLLATSRPQHETSSEDEISILPLTGPTSKNISHPIPLQAYHNTQNQHTAYELDTLTQHESTSLINPKKSAEGRHVFSASQTSSTVPSSARHRNEHLSIASHDRNPTNSSVVYD